MAERIFQSAIENVKANIQEELDRMPAPSYLLGSVALRNRADLLQGQYGAPDGIETASEVSGNPELSFDDFLD